ncbi:MAG: glycerate kinase [Cyclobacteriaceae bacterium]|jgi:glycerate kinase
MKKILICPNAFKGTLKSDEVAECIEIGLSQNSSNLEIFRLPIADGGDGSLPILSRYFDAELVHFQSVDALGSSVDAHYGWSEKLKIGIVELAEASGIRHINSNDLNVWNATTYGTGLILKEIMSKNPSEIYLAVGGSASIDGAIGILSALGVKFFNSQNEEIQRPKPSDMFHFENINAQETKFFFRNIQLKILCDVENPLLGENGCASVFGPQKGATAQDIIDLEKSMKHFNEIVRKSLGKDVSAIKHGGAAGGVAAFLHGIMDAELADGAAAILQISGFNEFVGVADIVITGEGKIDNQTLFGKGPGLVAKQAKNLGKFVVGFCGVSEIDSACENPFDKIIEINKPHQSLLTALSETKNNLIEAAQLFGKDLKV